MKPRVAFDREWSWLKGGVALGLLSAFAFITYKPLGVSTSYPRAVALALNRFVPDFVANNAYFQRVPPVVDWQLMLVLGIVIGGFIAARVMRLGKAQDGHGDAVPTLYVETDSNPRRRKWMAFLGGFLILFGARLAGGCTSGHVITGFTQMASASFIFAAGVFGAGIPMAKFLRKRGLV